MERRLLLISRDLLLHARLQANPFSLDVASPESALGDEALELGWRVGAAAEDAQRAPHHEAVQQAKLGLPCQAAFKNFPEPVSALNEMYRVLSDGGTAVIEDMSRDASGADIDTEITIVTGLPVLWGSAREQQPPQIVRLQPAGSAPSALAVSSPCSHRCHAARTASMSS